jgi:hypothetical protein
MEGWPRALRGLGCWLAATAAVGAADVEFDRDVRPLLNAHCVACHGGVKKAGGVSFIARSEALVEADSGVAAIVPGDAAASELVRRVTAADEAERMPPPDHGRALTAREVATLRAWIDSGATWTEHWSFVPPRDVPPAPAAGARWANWGATSLDPFVAARADAAGLEPAAPAGAAEWLRRVSLDLVGLPPTVDEFDAFLADGGGAAEATTVQRAKERVVDRLLASPPFGERWASVWLDLARYADTFGFEKDPTRSIWPWRDWVIRAFNADLPFDEFTIRQLAGDLLPNPTTDDLLATAFQRNTQTNTEGGTDDEEYRMAAVLDRVNTTWTTWQATTFGCVQCHAHPYDPYPHDDYYRFLAYFDGTLDCDQNDETPTLTVPEDPAEREGMAMLVRTVAAERQAANAVGVGIATRTTDWAAVAVREVATTGGTLQEIGPGAVEAGGTLPVGVRYDLDVELPAGTTAIRLAIDLDSGRDEAAPPERGAVASFVEITVPGEVAVPPAVADREDADGEKPPEPRRLVIAEVIADTLDGPCDPRDTLRTNSEGFGGYPGLTRPRWCVFVLDDPAALPPDGRVRVSITQSAASNAGTQACTLRRFRLDASADAAWSRLAADPDRRAAAERLRDHEATLRKVAGPKVPVLREQPAEGRRTTHLFMRGNRLDCGAAVTPAIPAAVAPPAAMPADRLGMARWLVGGSNPLAARVLANRLWAEMFGIGLVETLEDFGSSGARPSHPELLDHLAVRLVRDHAWSIKRFLRELALSATYGQTAAAPADLVARDPRNRLLARGPRSRLTAEMVRDQALVWSGRLTPDLFGPPVFPPQPEGIWRSVYSGATWETSTGADRFRRSIYTFVKRTAGYPALLAFDAPSRDVCAARRFPTNTPLQPLATLNDPMMVELAAGLAARMAAAGATPREQIAFGCRVVTLESPPASMIAPLERLHAEAVATAARAPSEMDLDPLTVVATALLNLDMSLVR